MAREYAAVKVAIWQDDDFRDLAPAAQHLYFVLMTSAELSFCGVMDWRPKRLAPRAKGWTEDGVKTVAGELSAARLIVVDEQTEEVLVRSFLRHDGVMKHNKTCISAMMAFSEIASNTIRGVVVHELRRLEKEFPEWPAWGREQVREVLKRRAVAPGLAPELAPGVAPGLAPGLAESSPSVSPRVSPRVTPAPAPSTHTPLVSGTHNTDHAPADADAGPAKSKSRGTRIPEPFTVTPEMVEWARRECPGLNHKAITERFVDYWRGVAGSKSVKLDWPATWRNWMRREAEGGNTGRSPTERPRPGAGVWSQVVGGEPQ